MNESFFQPNKSLQNTFRFIFNLLLFFFFVGNYQLSYAQTIEVDSLKTLLTSATSDTERITLMSNLVDELMNIDLQQAHTYALEALELSQKIGNKTKEANALYNMGMVLYDTGEREYSIDYYKEAKILAEDLGLKKLQAHILMSIGRYYRYSNLDSTKTVNSFLRSVELSKSINYDYGTARSYAKLASFYTKYHQLALSEKYLDQSAIYYKKTPDGLRAIAHYYTEVGDKIWDTNPKKSMDLYLKAREYTTTPYLMASLAKAYSYIGDYETALTYLNEAIPYFQKNEKTKRMLGISMAQLAEVHMKLGNFEAANELCDEGIEILTPLGRSNQKAIPALYRVKGIIAEHEGNDEAALEYFTISIDEAIRIKVRFERIKSMCRTGSFYVSRDAKKGEELCKKALRNAQKYFYSNLEIQACDCLYNLNKQEGSYEKALEYHEKKILLTDSLSTLKVEHAFDINNKITQKDSEQEIRDQEFESQKAINRILFIASLLALLLTGFLAMSYRRISRQNQEINKKTVELENANKSLEQSNKELERFAHIASHDLKSPLSTMLGFTGLLRSSLDDVQNQKVHNVLNFIEKSGKRMYQLIDDILEYSKLAGQVDKETELIELNVLVDEIIQLTQHSPNSKKVRFIISELPNLNGHYSKIFLLFKNLIENGIKYNESETPSIKIYSTRNESTTNVYISDNGIGIEQKYFDKIFVMFNRLHTKDDYEGTGLGLATCKKIMDEFDGGIIVSSEIGKGTIFKLEFPNHLVQQQSIPSLEAVVIS